MFTCCPTLHAQERPAIDYPQGVPAVPGSIKAVEKAGIVGILNTHRSEHIIGGIAAISASVRRKADSHPATSRPTLYAADAAGAARNLGATFQRPSAPNAGSLQSPASGAADTDVGRPATLKASAKQLSVELKFVNDVAIVKV